jgi:hypothetical protein
MLHGGFFSAFNRKIIGVYVVYGSSINWWHQVCSASSSPVSNPNIFWMTVEIEAG